MARLLDLARRPGRDPERGARAAKAPARTAMRITPVFWGDTPRHALPPGPQFSGVILSIYHPSFLGYMNSVLTGTVNSGLTGTRFFSGQGTKEFNRNPRIPVSDHGPREPELDPAAPGRSAKRGPWQSLRSGRDLCDRSQNPDHGPRDGQHEPEEPRGSRGLNPFPARQSRLGARAPRGSDRLTA